MNKLILQFIFLFSLIFIFTSCKENIRQVRFNFFLSEPCMIVNYEQDNTIEGSYLTIKKIKLQDTLIIAEIDLPEDFYISSENFENWVIGWGSNKPYYDGGSENIREIVSISSEDNHVVLGNVLRGRAHPEEGRLVVFWNRFPSGFRHIMSKPAIDLSKWPDFNGDQAFFGAIEFDSILNCWVMLFNEVSLSKLNIYSAYSYNLTDWKPANKAKPVLTASDFADVAWAGTDITGEFEQTPYLSDVIHHDNKWYLFFYGFCEKGKRHVGMAVSDSSLSGPYQIFDEPLLSPGNRYSWENAACLSARVEKYGDGFIMFYVGKNNRGRGNEAVGMAKSNDLITWEKYKGNPVLRLNSGWRSCKGVAEPNYIEVRNDSILLMVLGAKEFNHGLKARYITKRMYMDKSGNVDKNQLGVFLSTDGGKSFDAHINNPVFVNDYTNILENNHVGGSFKRVITDTSEFIFYQGKTGYNGFRYNIMIRERKLNRM